MRMSRTIFFILLAGIFVVPFFVHRIIWLFNSVPATGEMCFMGKTLNGQFSSTYPVIKFSTNGKDKIFFNGNEGPVYQQGDLIAILYQKSDPKDARINQFSSIWVDTIINAIVPFVLLLIVFVHPDLIPRKSKILLGKKPFIQLVP